MAAAQQPVVDWITSKRGQPVLVVDNYIFSNSGKGKGNSDVRYWSCLKGDCDVKATSSGCHLIYISRPDHGHENDYSEVCGRKLVVSYLQALLIFIARVLVKIKERIAQDGNSDFIV